MKQYLPSIMVGIVMAFVAPLLAAWALGHRSAADRTCDCADPRGQDDGVCRQCGRKRSSR